MKKTKPIYKLNYYKKILNIIKKFKISNFDLITNYGLFSGDTNLFKTLTIKYLIDRTAQVKGDIIEFGVWRGNTSFLIKPYPEKNEQGFKCIYMRLTVCKNAFF